MSQPIDQLIIAVKIEEGSDLEDLYNILSSIQQTGGRIEVVFPQMVTQNDFTGLLMSFESLKKQFDEIKQIFPEWEEKFNKLFKDWLHELDMEVISALLADSLSLQGKIEGIELTSKQMSDKIDELIKAFGNIEISDEQLRDLVEQFSDFLKEDLDDLWNKIKINLDLIYKDMATFSQSEDIKEKLNILLERVGEDLMSEVAWAYTAYLYAEGAEREIKNRFTNQGLRIAMGQVIIEKLKEFKNDLDDNLRKVFDEKIGELDEVLQATLDQVAEDLRGENLTVPIQELREEIAALSDGFKGMDMFLGDKIGEVLILLNNLREDVAEEEDLRKEFEDIPEGLSKSALFRGIREGRIVFPGATGATGEGLAAFMKTLALRMLGGAAPPQTPEEFERLGFLRQLINVSKPEELEQLSEIFGLGEIERASESKDDPLVRRLIEAFQTDIDFKELFKIKNDTREIREVIIDAEKNMIDNLNKVIGELGRIKETAIETKASMNRSEKLLREDIKPSVNFIKAKLMPESPEEKNIKKDEKGKLT